MEDILKTIGKNIKKLMDMEGISMRALSDVIGVKHPTLSSYISGESAIDSAKLFTLAEYFHVDFDDFFKDDIAECALLFRADNPAENINDNERNVIYNKIRSYIDIVGEGQFIAYIPQNYNLKIESKRISKDEDIAIKRIAKDQRKMMGIESIIPDNYYNVFADNNINVMAFSMDNGSLFGCSSIDKNFGSLIYVNTSESISEERQLFSLCHEYAHLLFHRDDYSKDPGATDYRSYREDIREKLADRFAGYFLIPEDILKERLGEDEYKGEKGIKVAALKHYFKVSYSSLVIALHNYGIISDFTYRQIYKQIMAMGYDRHEPAPLPRANGIEKNHNLIAAMKVKYLSDEISSGKIKELLGIDNESVRNLIRSWNAQEDKQDEIETIQI